MTDKPIKILDSKLIHRGRIFDVVEKNVQFPDSSVSKYSLVEHHGAVAIIPQLEKNLFLMIRQYRVAIDDFLLEFPAGCLEKGEQPLDCAKREVIEEVGYQAKEMISLGRICPAPGFCNEIQHCFLAKNLTPAFAKADDDEFIEVVPMTITEIEEAICSNRLIDAKSISLFARARLLKFI